MIDRRVRLVRQLKGAPLSVWIALIFAGPKQINQSWLIRSTGYSDKPVRQALAYLSEHGCIIPVQGGWLLSEAAMRLVPGAPVETAPPVETGPPEPPVEAPASGASPPASPPNSDADGQIRNNSDSPISIINNVFKDSLKLNNTNNAGRKNSDYTGKNAPFPPLFSDSPDPGAALQAFGIRQKLPTCHLLHPLNLRVLRPPVPKIRGVPYPFPLIPSGSLTTAIPENTQSSSAFPTHFAYQQMVSTICEIAPQKNSRNSPIRVSKRRKPCPKPKSASPPKPYHQRPDEPDRWYDRFYQFCLLGPSRTLIQ